MANVVQPPSFGPTLDTIHQTLVSGFHGYKLPSLNGKQLVATNTNNTTPSGGNMPFLAFRTGTMTFSPWKDFEWYVSWDIPATLTVQGPGEDGEISARKVLMDIVQRTMMLVGLPVDLSGTLLPLDSGTVAAYDSGEYVDLCERGAPLVKSAAVVPLDDGLCRVELVFHVESTLSLDERVLVEFDKGTVKTASGDQLTTDLTIFPSVVRVDAIPYAVSLSASNASASLRAQTLNKDFATTNDVTSSGTWASSNTGVATVSAAGVVSRVAAGTATITCTYGHVTSNGVVVTCT